MTIVKTKLIAIKFTQPARVEPDHIEPLRAIHFDSFPPSNRGDFDEWLAEISSGEKFIYTATINDELIGYATILPDIAPRINFLEYLAVAREHRNAGIGGKILRHLAQERRDKADGLIWEVKSDEAGNAEERTLRARRIAFYSRHGAILIDNVIRFRSPNLAGGEPLEEKLMWLSLNEKTAPPRGEKLRVCVIGILTKDYGLAREHPSVQGNLRNLAC